MGDAFNGDAATVRGVEALIDVELARDRGLSVPLSISYTWMRARFDSDIADTDFFGPVGEGDPIPYIPDHQLSATLGLLRGPLEAHVGLNYVDAVCVRASCGEFERTDDAFTVDVALTWALNDRVDLFARVENLTRFANPYSVVTPMVRAPTRTVPLHSEFASASSPTDSDAV